MDMIAMLKGNEEINPPNYFFIDIQSDQTQKFIQTLDRVVPESEYTLTPLVRSKFYGIDKKLAKNWPYKNKHKEEWFITRNFVTTLMDGGDLPKDNVITKEHGGKKKMLQSLKFLWKKMQPKDLEQKSALNSRWISRVSK